VCVAQSYARAKDIKNQLNKQSPFFYFLYLRRPLNLLAQVRKFLSGKKFPYLRNPVNFLAVRKKFLDGKKFPYWRREIRRLPSRENNAFFIFNL
jgi:hypothetical protein